jgi:glycosyltransferase involved in cell wall biosynthesis
MDKDITLSVIIPSRNEKYLNKTVEDLLSKAEGKIEIIEILDGYWEAPIADPRVKVIHRGKAMGMRAGINAGVAIARGEYILKTDAHCLFAQGFDLELIKSCEDKTVIVPRRYRLDAENWKVIEDGRPPIDRMSLSEDMHGRDWQEGNTDAEIEETPSSQGSCWLMKKSYFYELELMDEKTYGTFWSEFQEIGLKCWLSGGRVLVNKKTWYAHLHKKERGYKLSEKNEFKEFSWHKQIYPLSWLIEKFA